MCEVETTNHEVRVAAISPPCAATKGKIKRGFEMRVGSTNRPTSGCEASTFTLRTSSLTLQTSSLALDIRQWLLSLASLLARLLEALVSSVSSNLTIPALTSSIAMRVNLRPCPPTMGFDPAWSWRVRLAATMM